MTRAAKTYEDIPRMADEVALLIASRLGGARRGQCPSLHEMLRRRGGALPPRLRRRALRLARADQMAAQPKVARQLPVRPLSRDHAALLAYLKPLGEIDRWQGRAIGAAASLALGLMIVAALAVWIMLQRGLL